MRNIKTVEELLQQRNLIGQKFGELEVIGFDYEKYIEDCKRRERGLIKSYQKFWVCKCSCGKIKSISDSNLLSGNTSSCNLCYTFEDWCNDNEKKEYLDLWDYELNKCKPNEIKPSSNKKYWFKCKKGVHKSEQTFLQVLTSSKKDECIDMCRKCNSFGEFLKESGLLHLWSEKNSIDMFSISKCSGKKVKMKCENGHKDYLVSIASFNNGSRCPICVNQKVIRGVNDVATTHPHIIKYFVDKEEAYKYSYGSEIKCLFRCDLCGNEKRMSINTIVKHGIRCVCGDGISYPNKIITSLLSQTFVNKSFYSTEKTFEWSMGRRFDFYIPSLDCIIEAHGLQHYEEKMYTYKQGRLLEEEQENDRLKEQLAKENGIKHYIVLDCRYSRKEHIKESIMNSKLPILLGFKEENIDWDECNKFALNNIVKETCDLWNSGKFFGTPDLGRFLNLDRSTVRRYLKNGTALGWCEYDAQHERYKGLNGIKKKIV